MTLAGNAIGANDGHRHRGNISPSAVFAACGDHLAPSRNATGGIGLCAGLVTDPAVWVDPIAFKHDPPSVAGEPTSFGTFPCSRLPAKLPNRRAQ